MNSFPGIDDITTNDLVFRSLGGTGPHQLFGAGFMNKSEVQRDNIDLVYPHYVIVYVLKGKGVYIDCEGREYPVGAGDFFQRIPGLRHSNLIEAGCGWRECFVVLTRDFYQFSRHNGILREDAPVAGIGLDSTLIARIWRFKETIKTAPEEDLPQLALECMSLAAEFHRRLGLSRHGGQWGRIIGEVCERLGRDFHQHPDLETLCQEYGCGYESFRKEFRRQVGVSPGQYRIRRRIDAACEMLNENRFSISEISWMLGYSSPFEFSAQFKKYLGCAPTNFRGGNRHN